MTHTIRNSTAMLATAFGFLLSKADAQKHEDLDLRTARELAVLSRILEKRLADMRADFAHATAAAAVAAAPARQPCAVGAGPPVGCN